MPLSKKDMARIAEGFKYIADDPTADRSTVIKMVQEFSNAAQSLNPRFDRGAFGAAVFGEGRKVRNPWDGSYITCGACGYDKFNDRGRSLDRYNHECVRCGHTNHTMTETGMSA
jgi:hypothetical protein